VDTAIPKIFLLILLLTLLLVGIFTVQLEDMPRILSKLEQVASFNLDLYSKFLSILTVEDLMEVQDD
jgi:hypothetical protein